jgi:uncharacterized damage-inducible protein DinB
MLSLDLLDRLLGHDLWATRRALELCQPLTDAQLDQDFDLGHHTVRETLQHMIGNVEIWTDLMADRPPRPKPAAPPSVPDLQRRFKAAYADFAQLARNLRDTQRLNDTYLDVLDQPPRPKSYAGTILHVITHDHMHRAEIFHMLQRLGVPGVIEGDVLSWESTVHPTSSHGKA